MADNILRRELLQKLSKDYSPIPKKIQHKYGQNIKYPLSLDDNVWDISIAEESIRDSFYVILATPIGTRLMQPDFGSMIPLMVGQPYTPAVRQELILYTSQAIARWEPRVTISRTDIDEFMLDANIVQIRIQYYIKGIQGLFDFLIPINLYSGIMEYPASTYTVGGYPVFDRQSAIENTVDRY